MTSFHIETRKVVKAVEEPVAVMEFTEEQVRLLRLIVGQLDGQAFQKLCRESNVSRSTDGLEGDYVSTKQIQPLYNLFREAHEEMKTKK